MTGNEIVGGLLRNGADITAKVQAANIRIGKLPDGITLPALLIRTISLNDVQMLARGSVTRSTARVSVTVRAANYRDQAEIIRLVRTKLSGWVGDFGAVWRISILTAGLGPDLNGPGDSFEQAQDFRVSFDANT